MTEKNVRTVPIAENAEIHQKLAYHHGDLRAQLVAATRQLVEEKGPDKFSVSEACRCAGVSTAAPYRHFADKQDMLIAVAIDGMLRMRDEMAAAIAGHPQGSYDSIAAIGLVYVTFAQREPGVFRLMFGLTRDHEKCAEMNAAGGECYGILLGQVARFLGRDVADEAVYQAAFPLWTLVHGTSFLLIDQKVKVLDLAIDVPAMLREGTERLLGPKPA